MPQISIKGAINDSKHEFVRTNLPLDTETVVSVVTAGQVAVIIDSGVDLESGELERHVKRLMEALREAHYSMT